MRGIFKNGNNKQEQHFGPSHSILKELQGGTTTEKNAVEKGLATCFFET